MRRRSITGALALMLLACSGTSPAAETVKGPPPGTWSYEDDNLRLRVRANPPDGIAAFYEARGFTQDAIALLRSKCFMTVSIRNKNYPVLWLEPDNWRVLIDGKQLQRYPMSYWQQQFDELGVPDATRAAFRWTQLPERRDLRVDEPVGGNITLPPLAGPFTLLLRFDIGRQRGDRLVLRFSQLSCAGRSG